MIRVVVVDDQSVVRDGVVLLLSTADDIEVVGAGADGEEAVALCHRQRPDVALLDLRMPGLDGAAATARITAETPTVRVLVLTTYADDDAILPALRAGAKGYLTKDATAERLLAAVRDVAGGLTVLDPAVQQRLVELATAPVPSVESAEQAPSADPDEQARPSAPDDAGLTRREVDVIRLVAEGLSNQQIARRLVLSEATVKTHLNHVLSKLDVDGRPGLVAWAWRNGYGASG
jgi:DNA-binding NarL/FixJ family response regulator